MHSEMDRTFQERSAQRSTLRYAALVFVLCLAWLVCAVAQFEKYLSLPRAAAACALASVCVVLLLVLLRKGYYRNYDVGWWVPVSVFVLLVLSFAVIYPRSKHHAPGKGSDREDALRVELEAVTHHRYPYAARTYLHHPPTPLPGAMWLAAPFYFAGSVAAQNLIWAIAWMAGLLCFFARRATAAAFFGLFLLTALENLGSGLV